MEKIKHADADRLSTVLYELSRAMVDAIASLPQTKISVVWLWSSNCCQAIIDLLN